MTYVPGRARHGEPTPQTDPDLFSVDEIRAEIRHLSALDRRYGPHTLRALARVRLTNEIARRLAAEEAPRWPQADAEAHARYLDMIMPEAPD